MFYTTDTNRHGLAHDPFTAIVAPRPIGWIGSKGRDGSLNLAPYSFFNAVADKPKLVMFSSSGHKHSQRNARETGVFTCNFVSRHLAERMNLSSAALPYGASEFDYAGLTPKHVDVPELLRNVDYVAAPPIRIAPEVFHDATKVFYAPVDDFELSVTDLVDQDNFPRHTGNITSA